jgi:hypothetical protein
MGSEKIGHTLRIDFEGAAFWACHMKFGEEK